MEKRDESDFEVVFEVTSTCRDEKTGGVEDAETNGEVTYFAGQDLFESETL